MTEQPPNPDPGAEQPGSEDTTRRDSEALLRAKPTRDPLIGTKVDQYSIKRVIGEGGMGVVYEALQQSPRRTVALKMMKLGVTSKSALRRFEYEAQTLGRLRHDGIAQIYEAGTWDDGSGGRPWFAMEYLPGAKTLTRYCKDKKFGTRERLDIFSKVCAAVQHGHAKGIIHRDLKPSNILVASSGVPKIIDFGVARSTDSDMAVTTLQTDVGALIGTLQYMSPEQCDADPNDIDIRSDVYALGVVLYELLCDQPPYALRHAAIHEAARIIREEEPTKPSSLDKRLRGDIETIALKALEKDRDRRYQSATALEEDIDRYLAGDPITAKAPSAIDYIRRFARKHKAASVSIAAIFVVLVSAVIAISIFAVEANAQRRIANDATVETLLATAELKVALANNQEALEKLTQEYSRGRAALDFLQEMLTFDPAEAETLDTDMVKQMLATAEQRLDEETVAASSRFLVHQGLDEETGTQPLVEAGIRYIIGNSYLGLTMLKEAEPHLRKALEIREELRNSSHVEVLESKYIMGLLHKVQGRYAEAEPYYRQALEGYRSVHGDEHEFTLWTLTALGKLLQDDERYLEAEKVYRESLETSRLAFGNDAPHTITAMTNLGDLLYILARYDEALDLFEEALSTSLKVYGPQDPRHFRQMANAAKAFALRSDFDNAEGLLRLVLEGNREVYGNEHYRTLVTIHNMGSLLMEQGRYDEAEHFYREAMEANQRVLGNKHRNTRTSTLRLADNLRKQARYGEAEELYLQVLEANPNNSTAKHMMSDLLRDQWRHSEAMVFCTDAKSIVEREHGRDSIFMVEPLTKMGQLLMEMGQLEEAESQLREALERLQELLAEDHPRVLDVRSKMATLRIHQDRFDGASSILQEVLDGRRDVLGAEHPDTLTSISRMGTLLSLQSKYEEAMSYFVEALETRRRVLGDEHPDTLTSISRMGTLLSLQSKYDEAMPYYVEALEKRRRILGDEHPRTLYSIGSMGTLLLWQGKYDEAMPYYVEALEKRRRVMGDEHPDTLSAIESLIKLYHAWDKPEQAQQYRAMLEDIGAKDAETN